ncbi:MAG TPA: pilus assembly PilX N-terminal domain-containing protein, partial [Terriglobales bacterium]|nr:pilus assembly PilX N-terminal domain-containing protein [Terriglobales bacterium]
MRRNERGIALLLCIMALMVLTGIAIGLMYMTDSETLVNANYRTSQQAYFAALAGLQNVRQRMTPGLSAAQGLLAGPTVLPGTANSFVYVVNPYDSNDTVKLAQIQNSANQYYDGELKAELTAQGISTWPQSSGNYVGGNNLTAEFPASNSSLSGTGPYMGPLRYKWVRVNWKTNAATAPY